MNSFYKIKPGEDLIEKTGFRLLDKDSVSRPLSGLIRTFSNKSSMSNNYARADSCLKEFIFRGVSFNENDADFMRRSSSDSDSTTVVDQSELRRNNTGSSLGFSTFFEHPMDKPYDFGRMPSGTSDRCILWIFMHII